MSNEIDREHVDPGTVTMGKTRDGYGYGHDGEPNDTFNYFIDDDLYSNMLYLYLNTGQEPRRGLHMDPRDAEIMGLQLVYLARKMMKEKGVNHETE